LDADALAAAYPAPETVRARILEDWGGKLGEDVWAQYREKALHGDELREEIRAFCRMLPALREKLAEDLQPAGAVARCIRLSGGPVTPEEMAASTEEFHNGVARARYIRNRLTVLDLAAELGAGPA
jgi:hypothetical protein